MFAPVIEALVSDSAIGFVDLLTSLRFEEGWMKRPPDAVFELPPRARASSTFLSAAIDRIHRASSVAEIWNQLHSRRRYGLIVVGNDGGGDAKAIIIRARKLKIPTVVMQDGRLVNVIHPPRTDLVRRWRSVLVRPFPMLNRLVSSYPLNTAEYALVYGPYAYDVAVRDGFPASKLHVVGSPRHQVMRETAKQFTRTANNGLKTILFLASNFPAGTRRDEQRNALEALVEAVQQFRIQTDYDCRVSLRPHPRESREKYLLEVGHLGIDILEPSEMIERQIGGADVVASYASTGLLDAAICGKHALQIGPDSTVANWLVSGLSFASSVDGILESLIGFTEYQATQAHGHVALGREILDANPDWDSVKEVSTILRQLIMST